MTQADALAKIKSGEIAATVLFAGKPAGIISQISKDAGLRLLAVPLRSTLENTYYPANLTSQDYPNLISAGETIETISVATVLVTNNWVRTNERYRRLAKFVDLFFSKFAELQKPPRHAKWAEVNIAAELPGWQRFAPAQEWLDRQAARSPQPQLAKSQADFKKFMDAREPTRAAPLSDAEKEKLFLQFLEWTKRR